MVILFLPVEDVIHINEHCTLCFLHNFTDSNVVLFVDTNSFLYTQ